MILYTPIPLELVLSADADTTPPCQEVCYQGIRFLVVPGDRGMGKIIQLLSTDPSLYLKPQFQPGQEIPLFPWPPDRGERVIPQ